MRSDIDLYAVQLPGRENRIHELLPDSIEEVATSLALELTPFLNQPYAFFGHSLGAIVATEVARRLNFPEIQSLSHLIVSGCRALPYVQVDRQPIHDLNNEDLVNHIRLLNGTAEEVLRQPEMRALVLRVVRGDYRLFDGYIWVPGSYLSCPLTVFSGDRDPSTNATDLSLWSDVSSGRTDYKVFQGDHFFVRSAETQVLETIAALV